MMAANQSKTGPIRINGDIIGIGLSPSYVGQHQNGIDRLLRTIGAKGNPDQGVRSFDEHVATRKPEWDRKDLEHDEKLYLDTGNRPKKLKSYSSTLCVNSSIDHAIKKSQRYSPNSIVTGAWDESSFAIRGYGDEGKALVDLIQEGIAGLDLVAWISHSREFDYGSLCIARRTLIPDDFVQAYDAEVEGRRRLILAAEATGIQHRIDAAPRSSHGLIHRHYYALSPAWIDADRAKRSIHPVQFFLNPADSQKNNYGWFTVEELDQWLEGHGPVVKNSTHLKEGMS